MDFFSQRIMLFLPERDFLFVQSNLFPEGFKLTFFLFINGEVFADDELAFSNVFLGLVNLDFHFLEELLCLLNFHNGTVQSILFFLDFLHNLCLHFHILLNQFKLADGVMLEI